MTRTDITSPTVLLTGFTSGIGARMLEVLLEHPSRPNLVLLARGAADLEDALERVSTAGLVAMGALADLGDLGSIRTALEQVHAAQRRNAVHLIDVVLLNAGAQFTSRRHAGAQGHELTFTVNVMAQHLLLRGLEPLLAAGAHAVVLGSSTHRGRKASFNLVPDPRWQDPEDLARVEPPADGPTRFADERTRGGVAYASSKLALVTLAHEWAERLAASGHRLNTYDPGLIAGTGLARDMPAPMYWVWKNVMPAMSVLPGASTPRATARHAVRLALADAHGSLNGGYVEIGRVTRAEPATFAADRRDGLWAWLEGAVREYLPTYAVSGGSS